MHMHVHAFGKTLERVLRLVKSRVNTQDIHTHLYRNTDDKSHTCVRVDLTNAHCLSHGCLLLSTAPNRPGMNRDVPTRHVNSHA